VYRTYILFSNQKPLMTIPIMLWITLTGEHGIATKQSCWQLTCYAGLSIAVFVTSCGLDVVDGGPVNIPLYFDVATAWYSITSALQILTTGMIAAKLLQHRRALGKHLASSSSGIGYVSLTGILAESAVVYTISSIAFIPMFRSDSPVQLWWGQVVGSLAVRLHCLFSERSAPHSHIVPQPGIHHPSRGDGTIIHIH
jgi:hypothetical protein